MVHSFSPPACGGEGRRNAMTQYLQIGIFLITVPNLITIVVMFVLFGLGLWIKLPGHSPEQPQNPD